MLAPQQQEQQVGRADDRGGDADRQLGRSRMRSAVQSDNRGSSPPTAMRERRRRQGDHRPGHAVEQLAVHGRLPEQRHRGQHGERPEITSSSQSLFLLPENAPLSECAGLSGHETDADVAALQWQYFDLARANPRVIGLMNFGFWTAPAWTSGSGAASLPLTVDADERVTTRILAAASG
jgi:hypothetical protein